MNARFRMTGIIHRPGTGFYGWVVYAWTKLLIVLSGGAIPRLIEAAYEDGFETGHRIGERFGMSRTLGYHEAKVTLN